MQAPKRKTSRSRRDMRRAHDFLVPRQLAKCANCNEPKLSHQICPSCGMYRGRQYFNMGEKNARPASAE